MEVEISRLSHTERSGCTELLKTLSQSDLESLSSTVTNNMITVEKNAPEKAIDVILSYTTDAEELLKRKKVHRYSIFKYLAKEGVFMSPSSEKHQLVKRTLMFWSSGKSHGQIPALPAPRSAAQSSAVATRESTGAGFDPFALGKQFCQWFFQLLNGQNPSLQAKQPQGWGPQLFWPDAKLSLLSNTDRQQQVDDFQGAELVSMRLLALAKEEQLVLSPNLPDGLQVQADPHGLVRVAVAGTIHREGACLGVYEQVSGLIRAPLDNSWKIKFVKLKIEGQGSQNALPGPPGAAPGLGWNQAATLQ